MSDLLKRLNTALYAVEWQIDRGGMATLCLAEDFGPERESFAA
jgi:hypothetical protein